MHITIGPSNEELSQKAAADILAFLTPRPRPVFCVASGHSPVGIYQALVAAQRSGKADLRGWYFLGLDEWLGLGEHDQGSCRHMLNADLFGPLGLQEAQICFFDGKADPQAECHRIETFLEEHGPISLGLLGLGMNGHIGMNEPGTAATVRTHVSLLSATTRQVGQKYFERPQVLDKGLTLGLANLLEAERLLLVAQGPAKAPVVRDALEAPAGTAVPATLLRGHPDYHVYLDAAAAALLSHPE